MISNVKSFITKNCLDLNASIWGHISKKKLLVNTTKKAYNSSTVT